MLARRARSQPTRRAAYRALVTPTRARAAPRRQRPADILAPGDQIKIDVGPPPRFRRTIQRLLRFVRRARADPPETVRNPVDVRVDANVPDALEGKDQHQIRRLA